MPINFLTGSETERINEIENNWLNFESLTNDKGYNYFLYSVPVGQTYGAEFIVNSGTTENSSGSIEIEKRIHIFEDELEANKFINDVGLENISSYKEQLTIREDGSSGKKITIEMINYSKLDYELLLLNSEIKRGFKVEVFFSSSDGLREVQKVPEFNTNGQLINDTYLKYFQITGD